MLRSEPIIRYESVGAAAQSDVSDEVPERLSGSPIEPAAMDVNDHGALLSACRFGPPAGYPAGGRGFKGHAVRDYGPFHDVVKQTAASERVPSNLPFMGATTDRKAATATESSSLSGWIVGRIILSFQIALREGRNRRKKA